MLSGFIGWYKLKTKFIAFFDLLFIDISNDD